MTLPARLTDHFYIFGTIALGIYGQVVWKWQLDHAGSIPDPLNERLKYFIGIFLNPWIISGLIGAAIAAFFWIIALKKFEMSYLYPFVSLTFPGILLCSALLFGEPITWSRVVGVLLIISGIVVHMRS